jgi:shikimate dehydrogenase
VEEAPELPYAAIGDRHLLIDLIYNPEETRFLREGRTRGARTVNGTQMLRAQAEAAWELWRASGK